MPRWTKAELDAYIAKRNICGGTGARAYPVEEKQQASDQGQTDNKPKVSKVDRAVRPTYAIAISVFISDNRRRDIDNAATTLLDALMLARGRLFSHCEKADSGGSQGSQRPGRRNNNHNQTQ